MKKFKNIAIALGVFLVLILISKVALDKAFDVFYDIPPKDEIISNFIKNKKEILENIESGNIKNCEKIGNIKSVYQTEEYIEFNCGGSGAGGQTRYVGFYYFEKDDFEAIKLTMIQFCTSKDNFEFSTQDDGYFIKELSGDNSIYFEKIEDHFYYYELIF